MACKRGSTIVNSRSDLFGESKSSNMQSRVVYVALFVLMVTVLALVIALAVVATNSKNDKAGNCHDIMSYCRNRKIFCFELFRDATFQKHCACTNIQRSTNVRYR